MRTPARRSGSYRLTAWLALVILACATLAAPVRAQETPPAPQTMSAALTRVADDVYVFRDNTYEALFIVTDEGVIATDPIGLLNAEAPALYKAAIASVTAQPVRYVIYGHDH